MNYMTVSEAWQKVTVIICEYCNSTKQLKQCLIKDFKWAAKMEGDQLKLRRIHLNSTLRYYKPETNNFLAHISWFRYFRTGLN